MVGNKRKELREGVLGELDNMAYSQFKELPKIEQRLMLLKGSLQKNAENNNNNSRAKKYSYEDRYRAEGILGDEGVKIYSNPEINGDGNFLMKDYKVINSKIEGSDDLTVTIVLPDLPKNNYKNGFSSEQKWKYISVEGRKENAVNRLIAVPIGTIRDGIVDYHPDIARIVEKADGFKFKIETKTLVKGMYGDRWAYNSVKNRDYDVEGGHLKFDKGKIECFGGTDTYDNADNRQNEEIFNKVLTKYTKQLS